MSKKLLITIFISILLVGLLVACSESESKSDSSSDGEKGTRAETLIVGTGADPTTLDPRKTWSGPGYSINAHIFEPLVFRNIEDGKVSIEGVLAKSFENVDELTWKFTLHEGVTFHNGEALTAESVKFTFESILEPSFNTPLTLWLNNVDEIKTEGDLVLYIKTKTPTRALLSALTQIPIVAPSAVEELGDRFNVEPVGTGPYKIVEYVANNNVKLTRYEGYWGEPGVSENIEFRIMPENAVRLAALQRGDIHIAENISADKVNEVSNNPKLEMHITETLRVNMFVANYANEWMAKQEFRDAISLAIDRQALVDNILGGNTIAGSSVSPPGTIGFDDSLPIPEVNIDKAKELLNEIGYDGTPIKMGGPVGRYAMDQQIVEATAGMLEAAGINIDLETLEFSSYVPKMDELAYDFYYIGVADLTIDPTNHWGGYYYSETAEGGYSNSEVDTLIDEVIRTIDDGQAIELFEKVQNILYEEKPTFPLYYEPHMVGVREGVQNFTPRLDEYIIVRDAYFEE